MKTMMKKLLLLLVFLPCSIFAQATLSGVVSDATGPLPGVNVKVLGTSNGAATDFNGAYALKNLKLSSLLLVIKKWSFHLAVKKLKM